MYITLWWQVYITITIVCVFVTKFWPYWFICGECCGRPDCGFAFVALKTMCMGSGINEPHHLNVFIIYASVKMLYHLDTNNIFANNNRIYSNINRHHSSFVDCYNCGTDILFEVVWLFVVLMGIKLVFHAKQLEK